MKRIFTCFLLGSTLGLMAQTPDSVSLGASYPNKAYYSFANGEVMQNSNNAWDIKLAVYTTQTAAFRINGGFGAALYQYDGGDTTAWATLDTTGLASGTNWARCYDSDTTFEPSAFEAYATGHPNYGWGVYNNITHDVDGVKLFVIKPATGGFKKIWVKKQAAIGQTTTIRVANLDNSGDTTLVISRAATSKNYIFLDLSTNTLTDNEPANNTFELVFEKYEADLGAGSYYPVTGVTGNMDIKISEASTILPDAALLDLYGSYLPSTTNMTEIGHDWKVFNMTTFVYDVEDSLSYFVEDYDGNIWQIWFTNFDYTTGKFVFNTRQVGWIAVENENNVIANFNIYPNPTASYINLTYTLNNNFESANLSILNMNGQVVHRSVLSNNYNFNHQIIDIQSLGLAPGIYMARVNVGDAYNVQKFIVQ